jgi:phage tail sheath gpL-like
MSGPTQPTITFTEIPSAPNLQVPGDYIEIKAGYNTEGILPFPARNLIIGQMTASGSAAPLTIYPNITDPLTARGLAGSGSMADRIATAHLLANQGVPVDMILVVDAVGSAKAAWTRTFVGAPTNNGTYAENICGTRITYGVLNGDSAATQATDYAAAINAIPTLPITATVGTGGSSNIVTMTARNGGLAGNDFSFVQNPLPGDVTPPGTAGTLVATVVGATNPNVSTVIAVMAKWYTDVLLPWNDTANLLAASAEAERRFNAMVRQGMRWHYGYNGSLSQSLANAIGANARFLFQTPFNAPMSEPYCIAASMMGIESVKALNDPSQQLKGTVLPGVLGPVYANAWQDEPEQNALVSGGCSIFRVNHAGGISALRYVSTYTENAQGALDEAWHDIMEVSVAIRIRYDWQTYRDEIWGGAKLANDGDLAAQLNTGVCTPRRMKSSWATRCNAYAAAGWIIDVPNQIKRAVIVRDPNDPNRLNEQLYYTRIGNLMIDAGQMIFNVGGE